MAETLGLILGVTVTILLDKNISKDTTDEGVIEGNEDSAYWAEDPTYYVHNYNPSDSFHFESAVETAIDSWCSALGINMTPASEQDADICIYGGDEDTLRDKFKMDYFWVGSDAAAHCSFSTSLTGQNISVGGQNVKLKSMTSAKIFIPNGNRTKTLEKDVVTHELGHALGFCGHSPNNDDVMYYQTHNFDQLSKEESDFLKLMYLLGRDGA